MKLINHFDISRFWLLMKLELFRSRWALLITLDIALGLLFVGMFSELFFDTSIVEHQHTENYAFTLLVGGAILSSLAFNDLGQTLKKFSYLTLPVSTFERFLCMWLLTSIGWIVMFTLVFLLYSFLANALGSAFFGFVEFQPFDPFGPFAITTMKYYFIIHAIVLVGATHFKGYVLPKTLFTLLTVGFLAGFSLYFTWKEIFMTDHECKGYECELINVIGIHSIWHIVKWVFWWALAPVCWVIAFFGLKEKEV